ncbi:MAG TPA: ABC transporter ATP-binding protein [Propioniciclava sp.]|jgi:branched-chain amino acid transport system ATP-binding protein|uniref:ABC transporter ATP-binding protein n=1 Tax=Propioniciclava sp. TaxID=2038686 RepID=UPI002CF846A5|nr:ABC transporter ATP-binding protein [Propioniciclava sp.]HRL47890.1 ABC transporter ATP-binding protein [Propioniciclava sp.]HRL80674.1 ABC transporter ATP-binding protein [Propioniciclava sp.]
MLELTSVSSGYHGLEILHEVSLTVGPAEIVAIVGANGAGKSTTLKTIVGEVRVQSGSVRYQDQPVGFGKTHALARRGLMLVPEHRELFGSLTVMENLRMGARARSGRTRFEEDWILGLFPILAERRTQLAETMSGGQQQMLAIARALMSAPELLMLDEPSTGLSPLLTEAVFRAIPAIRDEGVSILIVEQNAGQVLAIADRAYVLESGSVALEGAASELASDDRVRSAYLGG